MKNYTRLLFVMLLCSCTLFSVAQGDTLEIQRNQKGKVSFARFTPNTSRRMQESVSFLRGILRAKPADEFRLLRESRDSGGLVHRRYEQYYQGIKVDNAQYLIHGKNGLIESINGDFQDVNLPSITPSLTEKQAIEKAIAYVNAQKYKWEDEGMEKFIKERNNNPRATYYPDGELVISKDYLKGGKNLLLAWKLNISSLHPNNEQWIYVNAQTGEVIADIPRMPDANTPSTAETLYSSWVSITGDSYSGGYRLYETRNGVTIHTRNAQNQANYNSWVEFSNSSTHFGEGWTGWPQHAHATDVHWGTEKVLDYWSSVHNRNSLNGSGLSIISLAHYTWLFGSSANAQWDGASNLALYGDGDGTNVSYVTSLDIVAHELGHGVTQYTSGLVPGLSESGALNEGFSDIWGISVENWADPNQIWSIGEEITLHPYVAVRNLQNPRASNLLEGQHPDTYQGQYWSSWGEPHANSTVLGHWFYLLVTGGSGWNNGQTSHASSGSGYQWQVCGVGMTDAQKIAYKAQDYLPSSSTYADARTATISAAAALFGSGSCQENAVKNAWYAVGVGTGTTSSPTSYTIVGDNSFCTSAVYTLSPTPPTGSIVYWSANPSWAAGLTPNGSQVTATTSVSDVFTLNATVSNCCGNVNASKPNIAAGVSSWYGDIWTSADQSLILQSWAEGYNYICKNTFVYFHVGGANSYTLISGTTSYSNFDGYYQTFQMDPGSYLTYAVSVTIGGCTKTLHFSFVPMDCPWLNSQKVPGRDSSRVIASENVIGKYMIAPNPVGNELTIYAGEKGMENQAATNPSGQSVRRVVILDMSGNMVIQQNYPLNATKMSLNIGRLSSAMYVARIFDGKEWTSLKFIKK